MYHSFPLSPWETGHPRRSRGSRVRAPWGGRLACQTLAPWERVATGRVRAAPPFLVWRGSPDPAVSDSRLPTSDFRLPTSAFPPPPHHERPSGPAGTGGMTRQRNAPTFFSAPSPPRGHLIM